MTDSERARVQDVIDRLRGETWYCIGSVYYLVRNGEVYLVSRHDTRPYYKSELFEIGWFSADGKRYRCERPDFA